MSHATESGETDAASVTTNDSLIELLTGDDQSTNSSHVVTDIEGFFSVYFSSARFTAETVIAMSSVAVNAAVLLTLVIGAGRCWTDAHHSKAVYRCLFANLAIADCLSSVSMWLGNNLTYLFGKQLASMNICLSIISLSAAFFMSSAFCLAAMMTVLGFAVVQYFSICHPLQNMTIVSTRKVVMYMVVSWLVPVCAGCLPLLCLVIIYHYTSCQEFLALETIDAALSVCMNVSVSVVAIIYVAVCALCCRIYFEVRQLRHRLVEFRRENSDSTSTQDRKAFVTTVILLATLSFFFLPHTIYFFVSLNSDTVSHDMSTLTSVLVILYMTLLPYLKMMSDPLVYGVRMCRRTSAGPTVTSRAVIVDAASTAAVQLRAAAGGQTPDRAVNDCCCVWWLRSVLGRVRGSVRYHADTYTAVVSSVPHVTRPHSWTTPARLPVHNAICMQTLTRSSVATGENIETEIL